MRRRLQAVRNFATVFGSLTLIFLLPSCNDRPVRKVVADAQFCIPSKNYVRAAPTDIVTALPDEEGFTFQVFVEQISNGGVAFQPALNIRGERMPTIGMVVNGDKYNHWNDISSNPVYKDILLNAVHNKHPFKTDEPINVYLNSAFDDWYILKPVKEKYEIIAKCELKKFPNGRSEAYCSRMFTRPNFTIKYNFNPNDVEKLGVYDDRIWELVKSWRC